MDSPRRDRGRETHVMLFDEPPVLAADGCVTGLGAPARDDTPIAERADVGASLRLRAVPWVALAALGLAAGALGLVLTRRSPDAPAARAPVAIPAVTRPPLDAGTHGLARSARHPARRPLRSGRGPTDSVQHRRARVHRGVGARDRFVFGGGRPTEAAGRSRLDGEAAPAAAAAPPTPAPPPADGEPASGGGLTFGG
jgi:hypothetical protein